MLKLFQVKLRVFGRMVSFITTDEFEGEKRLNVTWRRNFPHSCILSSKMLVRVRHHSSQPTSSYINCNKVKKEKKMDGN